MKCAIAFHVIFTLSLTACASISGPQVIDTNVNQWSRYEFSEGVAAVTIKVPQYLRVFNSSLPELVQSEGPNECKERLPSIDHSSRGSSNIVWMAPMPGIFSSLRLSALLRCQFPVRTPSLADPAPSDA
jgi:hypothetical protein